MSRPPTNQSTPINNGLRVLITAEQIQARIRGLAGEINAIYSQTTEALVVVCILKGGFMFCSDLAKQLTMPCQFEFVRLSSYGDGQKSAGEVTPVDLSLPPLTGQDVLLVDDIVDTGLTLHFLINYIRSLHQPRSLRLAVLLDKPHARKQALEADFVGFSIDNQFVVGYGLDHAGLYRNLPYIGYFPQFR